MNTPDDGSEIRIMGSQSSQQYIPDGSTPWPPSRSKLPEVGIISSPIYSGTGGNGGFGFGTVDYVSSGLNPARGSSLSGYCSICESRRCTC